MDKIFTIARATLKESLRDRILFGTLGFAVLFLLFTVFLGSISLGEDIRIIRNLGLAGIYLFGLIITIFLGVSLISKEIDRRTLYFVLSKPVARWQIVVGKFLGLWASSFVSVALMSLVYIVIVSAKGGGWDFKALTAVIIQTFEMGIFIALSITFSTFARPMASMIYAILVLYIGHSLGILVQYGEKAGGLFKKITLIFHYILPNLDKFNIRNIVIYDINLDMGALLFSIFYALAYSALLLVIASSLLNKREL